MYFRDIGKSEADRPDSGFDSKDGEEEDVSREEAKEEGSPEVKLFPYVFIPHPTPRNALFVRWSVGHVFYPHLTQTHTNLM